MLAGFSLEFFLFFPRDEIIGRPAQRTDFRSRMTRREAICSTRRDLRPPAPVGCFTPFLPSRSFFFPTTANKAKGKQTRNKKKTPRAGCGHFFYSCHKSDAAPRVLSSNTRNWENNEASLVKLEWHRTIVPWITRLGTSIVDNCQQIKVATAYTAINHSFQM